MNSTFEQINIVILITGDRYWTDYDSIYDVLSTYSNHASTQTVLVIHGNCKGVDMLADRAARSLGFKVEARPADWIKHGPKAGPIRNIEMIELTATYLGKAKTVQVLAFHDNIETSKGTKHCIEKAKQCDLSIILYSH